MKFNETTKQVKEFTDRMPFGVHKVVFVLAEPGKSPNDKEYIEVTFETENGVEDRARVWFVSEANANISFNTLRQIVVHNAKEADKDKARNAVDAVKDTDELVNLMNERIIGGEMWATKYYDPSRTYQNQAGDTKRSINVNIYGYMPRLRPELMPEGKKDDVTIEDLGGEPATGAAAANVPKDW